MQTMFIIIGVVILLAFVLPIFQQVFNLATVVGIAGGTAMLVLGIFWQKLSFSIQRYVSFVALVVLFTLIVLMKRLYRFGKAKAIKGNVLIVLGCRVKGDVPSRALAKRVDTAFYFLLNNPNSVAILSGGQGQDENLSEALCMKKLLVSRGVSEKRLYLEELSTSTNANIRNSKAIMDDNDLGNFAVICTSEYHQYRAKMICNSYGIDSQMISSKTMPILLPTFLLRELMAIVKEKFFVE